MPKLIDEYLQAITAQLTLLPAARREEEVREIRSHLEKAIQTSLQSASPEDGTAALVLRQFGPPQPLGRKILWAYWRERLLEWKGFWGAAVLALLLTFVPNIPGMVMRFALPCFLPLPAHWELQTRLPIPERQFELAVVLLLLPSSWLCGVLCGVVFPKRGVAGTALTEGFLLWLYTSSNLPFLAGAAAGDKLLAFLYLAQWGLCPLVVIFGAWIGSRMRRNNHAQSA